MTSPDLSHELAAQLRSSPPVAPPELRERVRAIVSRESDRKPVFSPGWFRLPRLRLAMVPAAAALVLVSSAVVFGLVRSGNGETIAADRTESVEDATRGAESAPFGTTAGKLAPTAPALSADTTRLQRVTATLTVEVADSDAVSSASQDALDLTRRLGGHVVSASVATGDEGTASLTVRVPADKVQDAVVGLSALGRITSQQITIDDLQEGIDAMSSRRNSVRGQIARITAQLESQTLDAETRAKLEARRQALRSELSQLRRGIATTTTEGRFATLQLAIVTPGASGVVPTSSRLDRTIDEALNVLVWEGVVALAMLVVIAPFVLIVLAIWLGRHLYRRQEERLLTTV